MVTQLHKWTFVLTDLSGNVIGELTDADTRHVVVPLSRNPTASFTIPSTHRMAPYFANPAWDGLLKCYRDGVIRFCGPVVSSDDQPSGGTSTNVGQQTITVTAAGPMWRLGYRLLGTASAGWALGTAASPYDLGYIAQQMLAAANSVGYTGITTGAYTATSNGAAGTFYMQPIDAALVALATGVTTFEFQMTPIEPANIGQAWPEIATFDISALFGGSKPNAIFEYGAGRANIASYGHTIDRTGMCNDGFINQPAATDHTGIIEYSDSTSITTRGRFQALIDDGGVQWDSVRNQLVQENVAIRTQARRILNITLVPNSAPNPFVDYVVGDQIPVRITLSGNLLISATLRVWGFTFDIDKNGNETVTLQLISP
jgi:hypothetical protein